MRITAKKMTALLLAMSMNALALFGLLFVLKKFFRAPLLKGEQNRTKAE